MSIHMRVNRGRRANTFVRLFILTGLVLYPILLTSSCNNKEMVQERKQKDKKYSGKPDQVWYKEQGRIYPDLKSTSSVVLPDGTVRCYFAEEKYVYYIESKDGEKFGNKIQTNLGITTIGVDGDKPANPAILILRSGRFMMLFNLETGEEKMENGASPTRLHLAYSDDGSVFEYQGVVADNEKDQYALVNQVDVILLPDGRVRLFSTENGISTAISKDGGRTWISDGIRLIEEGASEPDVQLEQDGTYKMFYVSNNATAGSADQKKDKNQESNPPISYIRKSISSDGLTWKAVDGSELFSDKDNGAVFNPDYVSMGDRKKIIYFSESILKRNSNEMKTDWRMATPADN